MDHKCAGFQRLSGDILAYIDNQECPRAYKGDVYMEREPGASYRSRHDWPRFSIKELRESRGRASQGN
jgi:hypothetical protein